MITPVSAAATSRDLQQQLVAPIVGSVGGAIGSFLMYKILMKFHKTPAGRRFDQLVEQCVNRIFCVREINFCPVFISFRVSEASAEAALLQEALAKRGVLAYVCNAGRTKIAPGEDWEEVITRAMSRCTLVVVLGTKTYGAEGSETIDTRKELGFALRTKKEIVVLKMTDIFTEAYAIMQLPLLQSIPWVKGDTSVPESILEYICGRVQTVGTAA